MRKALGERLKQIRASTKQADRAIELEIAHRTYAAYERGETEMGAEPLARLVQEGWNANWVLTGEGPERLPLSVSEPLEPAYLLGSQPLRQPELRLALQLVAEALGPMRATPDQHAELVILVAEMLLEGLPEAKVLHFARRAATATQG